MFVWYGDPVALRLGAVLLRWYGLLFAGGFIIGYFIMYAMFKRARYDTNDLDRLLIFIFLGTLIGARLGHCLIYEPDFFLAHPMEILKIWKGGLASHGGTIGVVLAFILFIKLSGRYRFFEIADMLTIPIALVCTMIRIGNFMNSEILGKPTNGDFGVIFARLGEDFPRYPAQLFEAAAYFITFLVLIILYFKWHKRPLGFLLGLTLFLIYTARFFIEPFKEEQADYSTNFILNVGQLLSIPFILCALAIMIGSYCYARKTGFNASKLYSLPATASASAASASAASATTSEDNSASDAAATPAEKSASSAISVTATGAADAAVSTTGDTGNSAAQTATVTATASQAPSTPSPSESASVTEPPKA